MVLSFYFLLRSTYAPNNQNLSQFYVKALRETITLGGDTDTNACIVGGLMGALVGYKNIPPYMVDKILTFDCTSK